MVLKKDSKIKMHRSVRKSTLTTSRLLSEDSNNCMMLKVLRCMKIGANTYHGNPIIRMVVFN